MWRPSAGYKTHREIDRETDIRRQARAPSWIIHANEREKISAFLFSLGDSVRPSVSFTHNNMEKGKKKKENFVFPRYQQSFESITQEIRRERAPLWKTRKESSFLYNKRTATRGGTVDQSKPLWAMCGWTSLLIVSSYGPSRSSCRPLYPPCWGLSYRRRTVQYFPQTWKKRNKNKILMDGPSKSPFFSL